MCSYTQSYFQWGHPKKIPAGPSDCSCEPIYITNHGSEGPKKKKHGKDRSKFKGGLKPLKENCCPLCLVEQKAKIIDQISAGGIGGIFNQIVSPDEPQPQPAKVKQPKEVEEQPKGPIARDAAQTDARTTGSRVFSMKKTKAVAQTSPRTPGFKKDTPIIIQEDGSSKILKWGKKWEGKTHGDMKRELRVGKMEIVDQIRALRDVAKTNGMNMNELDQKIMAQTNERRVTEQQKKKDNAQKVRNEGIDKADKVIHDEKIMKTGEKAKRIQEHLAREAARKARTLYEFGLESR